MPSIHDNNCWTIVLIVLAGIIGFISGEMINCIAFNFCSGNLLGKFRHNRNSICGIIFCLLSVFLLLKFDLSLLFIRNFILFSGLFFITIVDLIKMEIPDYMHIILVLNWLIFSPVAHSSFKQICIQLFVGFIIFIFLLILSLLFEKLLKQDGFGGGDIKLFGVLAIYFGFSKSIILLLLSCVFGLTFFLIMKAFCNKSDKKISNFPLAPAITLSSFLLTILDGCIFNSIFTILLK